MNTTSPSKRAGLDYYPAFFFLNHTAVAVNVFCAIAG